MPVPVPPTQQASVQGDTDSHQQTPVPKAVDVIPQAVTLPQSQVDEHALPVRIQEGQETVIKHMLTSIGLTPETVLSQDVLSHPEFMRALASVSASYMTYSSAHIQWKDGQTFSKSTSTVSVAVTSANDEIETLKIGLKNLAETKVLTTNLSVQLRSCQEKLQKMMSLLPSLFSCKEAMEAAIPNLQGAVRAQKQRKFNKLTGNAQYTLISSNSLGLSWEDATEKISLIEESGDNRVFTPLSSEQLKHFLNIRDQCYQLDYCGIPAKALVEYYGLTETTKLKEAILQLVDVFPLLCVHSGTQYVLIDFHEMVFRPNMVAELLQLDLPDKHTEEASTTVNPEKEGSFFYDKTGPKPLQEKYPELLTVMLDFIQMHGFAAHARRRTGTATSCGVRLEDVRTHVIANVDGLENISKSKIYNLLQPARTNTKEAAKHKDALDVRVGVKCADMSKIHGDSHEYFASAKLVREMCAMHTNECMLFSCDSKAKVHIGGQAVSRYHQLRTFFPSDDTPHYHDHDFPFSGYLIEPDGYLLLQSKNTNSGAPEMETDKLGREAFKTPTTGPLWLFNRCVKHTSTSIADHIRDVQEILASNPELKKPILALMTDGGPDWTPKSNINEFFLGRLWEDEHLDMLISFCLAPGQSRFNPIEHVWSSCSRWLAGVCLSPYLPGESRAPAEQSIPENEKREKEAKVFSNALESLNMYWNGKVHDGFRVTSKGITTAGDGYDSDYTAVKKMFDTSLKRIKQDQELLNLLDKWKFYVEHMDRRLGKVIFRRGACGKPTCVCQQTSVMATEVWKILPSSDRWLFPPITPDASHPGHYMCLKKQLLSLTFSAPDEYVSCASNGSCDKCRYYTFFNFNFFFL